MATLGATLNIGTRALYAHQQAINVTGNNIANANTEGYSRQRAVLQTAPTIDMPIGPEGTGVTAKSIQRIVDPFIDPQLNEAIQDQGAWDASQSMLERVEIVLNESDENGLNAYLSEFWNAWQDVSNNPSGYSERATLVGKAETLTTAVNQVYSDLTEIQADIDDSIDSAVVEINTIADRITTLNEQIHAVESAGGNANDQRDQRDQLLRDLSEWIDFTSAEDSQGRVTVTLGDGKNLVGAGADRLTTVTDASTGHQDVAWAGAPAVDLNGDIGGGKLRGWFTVRDDTVQGYIDDLNTMFTSANGLAAQVNTLHKAGYNLNSLSNQAFFTFTNAGDLAVDSAIRANPNLIAATNAASGVPGGNETALAIVALQTTKILNGGSATYDDAYNALVRDVGIQVSTATSNAKNSESMATYLEKFRESVSGVSLDEETVNLVKFQHAYEAAASLISTVDEMLDTVIAMV